MNRYRAIEISYLVWDRIAKNQSGSKFFAVLDLYDINVITEEEFVQLGDCAYCACCVYCSKEPGPYNCEICPGNDLWCAGEEQSGLCFTCVNIANSPYNLFDAELFGSKKRTIYAKEIADYFKNLLKEEQDGK